MISGTGTNGKRIKIGFRYWNTNGFWDKFDFRCWKKNGNGIKFIPGIGT